MVNKKFPVKLMHLENVEECKIIERLNRFVVKVEINGREELASNNNTGRLHEFMIKGKKAFCIRRKKPGKTRYSLFSMAMDGKGAIIDTRLQMRSLEIAIEKNLIPWLEGCAWYKRNPRVGKSLLDYLLKCKNEVNAFIEVKSAVLREDHLAKYPDCPTRRGQRHIEELIKLSRNNIKTFIVFIAAMPGVTAFTPNEKGDPRIKELLNVASSEGVTIKALQIYHDPANSSIYLVHPDLPVIL